MATIRILHLEDDTLDAELIHGQLATAGYGDSIEVVQTEAEFRRALSGDGLQLILGDYRLPGFDGLTALEIARETRPEIPFIFVSGEMGEERAIASLKAGAANYVLKDNLNRLIPAIENALAQAEGRLARGKAEAGMRELAQQWQNTFDAVSDAIFIVGEDHRILRYNKAFHTLLGNGEGLQILGRHCWELVHGTEEAIDGCPLERTMQSGKRATVELHLRGRWVELITEPMEVDNKGLHRCGVHIIRDITDQKEALEKIHLNEERLDALNTLNLMNTRNAAEISEYALEAVVKLTKSDGGYLYFFDQATKMLTLTAWSTNVRKQCMNSEGIHYALDKAGIWADCIRTQEPVIHNDYPREPKRLGLPEGHFPVLRHMSVPIFDGGQIVAVAGVANKKTPYDEDDTRQINLFMNDMWKIMKQKGLDLAIQESEAQNRKLAEESAAIVRAIPDVVQLLDLNLRILWGGGCGYNALLDDALAPRDASGQVCYEVFFQAKSPCPKCPILKTLAGKGDQEAVLKLPNDRTYSIRTIGFLNTQGAVDKVLALARDVTEQISTEEQLRHAQKMESVGTLAGGIAHDFNNLLTVIQGFTELLEMKLGPDSPHQASVAQILDASHRATRLVKGLLTFSRKREADFKPVSLNMIVRTIENMLHRLVGAEITLTLKLCPDDLIIEADSGHLDQVLMNFTANARDVLSGSGVIEIETERVALDEEFIRSSGFFGKAGDYALLRFRDNGSGMDEVTQKRIFDPFFTTKELGRGTGLGLSIVYGIVKQHHGFIECESRVGEGTVFSIYLPLTQSALENERATIAVKLQVGRNEKILLAEDDEPVRHIIRLTLEDAGFQVTEVRDGVEALEMFRDHPDSFQAVILDVVMPKKNGLEAYREIREIKPGQKVLFVTGYMPDETLRASEPELIEHFIYKPISPFELIRRLTTILDAGTTQYEDGK